MMPLLLACLLLLGHLVGEAAGAAVTVADNYGQEQAPIYWYNEAEGELDNALKSRQLGVAKNVIIFIGDGMGVSTVTAGRILSGQKLGKLGEEQKLSFESFPHTGFSKTYSTDTQVVDSAASATAILCGVKTRQGMMGVSSTALRGDCNSSKGADVDSILRWSAEAGKWTGVVTNMRVTHATPGGAYAHSAEREWESDRLVPDSEKGCEDIALQLITRNSDINVILGGGRAYFLPEGFPDPDPDPTYSTSKTSRLDRRNLVEEWKSDKQTRKVSHKFVYDKAGFDQVDVAATDYLLGLFTQNHMTYEIDRNATKEPSLTSMVEKAVGILSKNSKGFFLLVEGGLIDKAHHDSQASRALHEVVSLAEAVETAIRLTNRSETLIVVTADHSHVLNIAGYASRGNPILGKGNKNGEDGEAVLITLDKMPYTTILYGNGPGYNSTRQNLTDVDTQDKNYVYQSAVPMKSESHGGEDVGIYATGPQSFLFTGVHEQSYLSMAMAYSSCVGPYGEGKKSCAKSRDASLDCKPDTASLLASCTALTALTLALTLAMTLHV